MNSEYFKRAELHMFAAGTVDAETTPDAESLSGRTELEPSGNAWEELVNSFPDAFVKRVPSGPFHSLKSCTESRAARTFKIPNRFLATISNWVLPNPNP